MVAKSFEVHAADLERVLNEARQALTILNAFPNKYSKSVLEQAAISGILKAGLSGLNLEEIVSALAKRLDVSSKDFEKGWKGSIDTDGGLKLSRVVRGVEEVRLLDSWIFSSLESQKLAEMNDNLLEIYKVPAQLIFKDKEKKVTSPTDLFSTILKEGEKGLTLQRYKGLGEMNPDQLWETTLDPNARTLLRVKIDRFSDAHEIFDKLMGDVVEPRRLFIQENALTVTNLDF